MIEAINADLVNKIHVIFVIKEGIGKVNVVKEIGLIDVQIVNNGVTRLKIVQMNQEI